MADVARYLATRVRLLEFPPLAAFLTLAAHGPRLAGGPRCAAGALVLLALLVRWRVRDDLADRETDRTAHPERVLVRAARTRPVEVLGLACLVLALPGVAWLAGAPGLATLAGLELLGAAYYAWRGRLAGLAARLLLLLKYPALVAAVGGPADVAPAALGTVYATVVAFELIHDPRAGLVVAAPRPWGRARGYLAVLVGTGFLLALGAGV